MHGNQPSPASDLAETELTNTQIALIIFGQKVNEQIDFSLGQSVVAESLRQALGDATMPASSFTEELHCMMLCLWTASPRQTCFG
jgi:hypothetical protein